MRLGEDLVGLAVKRVTKFVERGIGECNRCLPRLITAGLGPNVACVPNVAFWHNPDLRIPAPEGPLTSGLRT